MFVYNLVSSNSLHIVPWTLASGSLDQLKLFNGLLGCGTFFLVDSVRCKAGVAEKTNQIHHCMLSHVSGLCLPVVIMAGAFGAGAGGGGGGITNGGGGGGAAVNICFAAEVDTGVTAPLFVPLSPDIF